MEKKFTDNYEKSFCRNIGIVSESEQKSLANATVAIAGLGGIGGPTFLTMVRMGIGNFKLADIDEFSLANLNRQVGASHKTIGKSKIEAMKEQALEINPEVKIELFPDGVTKNNVEDFVKDSDVIADCIDYFCISARLTLLEKAYELKVPTCFSAPLAFSAALICFDAEGMSYKEYFNIKPEHDLFEKLLRFTVGITPAALHLKYMNFSVEKLISWQTGPSIASSAFVGGGILAAEVLFTITKKRSMFSAPTYTQFDMFRGKYVKRKLMFGNKGLIQRIRLFVARKMYIKHKENFLKFIK